MLFICGKIYWSLAFFGRPVVDLISGSQHDSPRLAFSGDSEVSVKTKATFMSPESCDIQIPAAAWLNMQAYSHVQQ